MLIFVVCLPSTTMITDVSSCTAPWCNNVPRGTAATQPPPENSTPPKKSAPKPGPPGEVNFALSKTRTGWLECRNYLTGHEPLQVLNKSRKRLFQCSTNGSGSSVIMTSRLIL